MSMDNTPIDKPDNDDNEDIFSNLGQIRDAGESEESQQAESAARQTVINMAHRAQQNDNARAEAYTEGDLVKRARILASMQAIDYVHFKTIKDEFIQVAKTESELNRMAVFDALFDYGSGVVPYPYYDTFRGKFVDHNGEPFVTEKTIDSRELVEAMNAAGLDNPSARIVTATYMEWAKQHRVDGLLDRFDKTLPEWDGKPRMRRLLIELFCPNDNKLNNDFGQYFWLSLYNRITDPGAYAPISMALIGGQMAGKTYFSDLICKTLMQNQHATSIPLDMSARSYNDFLRDITGQSIIANVGEMTGFKKADIENMKAFATKTIDTLNFKFMDSIQKPRQWIIVMDGNEYAGLQRDDTGNRRFYPVFVGQMQDKGGQPQWDINFEVDFTEFESTLWQVMAECKVWMDENKKEGYNEFVRVLSKSVNEFNRKEMDSGRGVIRDEMVDTYLLDFVVQSEYHRKDNGWIVKTSTIMDMYHRRHLRAPHARSLKVHMTALGYEQSSWGASKGYLLPFHVEEGEEEPNYDLTHNLTLMYRKHCVDELSYTQARAMVMKLMSSSQGNDEGF